METYAIISAFTVPSCANSSGLLEFKKTQRQSFTLGFVCLCECVRASEDGGGEMFLHAGYWLIIICTAPRRWIHEWIDEAKKGKITKFYGSLRPLRWFWICRKKLCELQTGIPLVSPHLSSFHWRNLEYFEGKEPKYGHIDLTLRRGRIHRCIAMN